MTTERLINFPAKTNPAGTDIVYVGDLTDSGNEVKSTIAQLGAGMGGVVLLVANNLSDLGSASAARTNLGLGSAATFAATAFLQVANNLSDLSSASTARANLGLGTAAVQDVTFFLQVANNLSDLNSASTARTNLGLGTAAVAAASSATGTVAAVFGSITAGHIATFKDTSGTIQDGGSTAGFLLAANNLSDVANAATSRSNLGLGTAATKDSSASGATTLAAISGSITAGHYAQFADSSGTLQDGGADPSGVLLAANNLSDVASAPTSRNNLGLGNAAVANQSSATGTVAAVTGAITPGHLAVFSDAFGTIEDGGATPTGVLLAANNLSDVASASTSRTNLGLGTAATQNSTFFLQVANNLSDLASASTARTNLGLAIGTNVEAWNAQLDQIAAITPAQGDIFYYNGSAWVALTPGTSGYFLQTQGASANPQWAIGSANLTGAQFNFQQGQLTSQATIGNNTTWTATGLTIAITPTSSSNKVLVRAEVQGSLTDSNNVGQFRLARSGTGIGLGVPTGSQNPCTSFCYYTSPNANSIALEWLDSPATTSAITYTVQYYNAGNTSNTQFQMNTWNSNPSANSTPNGVSTISVCEVGTPPGATQAGTINSGTTGQLVYYSGAGTTVSGGQLGNIKGTATNDNAAAGNVGEFVSSQVLYASPVTVTGGAVDITSISLTAGDWDVEGQIFLAPAGAATCIGWISATSATLPDYSYVCGTSLTTTIETYTGFALAKQRFSLSTTTTIYLTGQCSGTANGAGFINARRVR